VEPNGPEYASGNAPDCGDRIVSESEVLGRYHGARWKCGFLPNLGKSKPIQ